MIVKVGCCGFPSGMKNYFKKFKLVEVQQTFYKPPKEETAKRWRDLAGKDFEFSLKAWQLITHDPKSPTYRKAGIKVDKKDSYGFFRNTKEVFKAWDTTRNIAKVLNARVIVFQCPSSFKPTEENIANLRGFFSTIDREFIYAWEPRGKWDNSLIRKLCDELDLVHCIDPFQNELAVKKKVAYFRLHGKGGRKYYYNYTEDDFNILLSKIGESEAELVYCLFNNIYMEKNALEFMKKIIPKK